MLKPQFDRSVIIPVFNGLNFLTEFWARLEMWLPANTELVIVDDASFEAVAASFPETNEHLTVKILRNPFNLGFAESVNAGVAAASTEFVHVLNTDVFLCADVFSPAELQLQRDTRLGVVGIPLIYPQNNRLQHCSVGFSDRKKRHVYRYCPKDLIPDIDHSDVQASTFAFASVRTEVWREMGGLDTGYYNRNEDIDFCLRLKQLGYRISVTPDVFAYHWESVSGPARFALDEDNEAYFWGQWYHQTNIDIALYLEKALQAAIRKCGRHSTFHLIDLTRSTVDPAFREMLADVLDLSPNKVVRRQRYSTSRDILLPMTLPFEMASADTPFLYLVDEWTQLESNSLWFETRMAQVESELIVDLNANALWSTEVF